MYILHTENSHPKVDCTGNKYLLSSRTNKYNNEDEKK